MDNYLTVAMFQIHYDSYDDGKNEFNVKDKMYAYEMTKVLSIIQNKRPDIALLPEMSFSEEYDSIFKSLSFDRIIIAGSYYKDGKNTTVVYQNGERFEFVKRYPSGREVMSRHTEHLPHEEFLAKHLEEHAFTIKGKKIYVFNCFEYYQVGYYVARDSKIRENLFGIFVTCANSNSQPFEQESICIHNHNEKIYTFVANTVGKISKSHGDGQSYIFGPVSTHEKRWLVKSHITSKMEIPSHILALSEDRTQYVTGKFLFYEALSRFARSDFYQSNPKDLEVHEL